MRSSAWITMFLNAFFLKSDKTYHINGSMQLWLQTDFVSPAARERYARALDDRVCVQGDVHARVIRGRVLQRQWG